MKVRNFEIVTDKDKVDIANVLDVLESKVCIEQYAYILHDMDETRPHYHICCKLKDTYDTKHISAWFNIAENFIGKVKGRWQDVLLYLTHKNAPTKYQYSDSVVVANFDFVKVREQKNGKARMEEIINNIVNGTIREYNYTKHITPTEFNSYKKAIDNAFKYRIDLIKGEDREMECIFIKGDSGVGKTTYAKKIANDKGYSTYVSSGSNDILDDYKGQDCLILDDLRPGCMGLSDLLKMLDNNTTSTVKSRYKNKVLECKLIIITTTLDIDTFFSNVFTEEIETCVQLKRRCRTYITMYMDKIKISVWQELSRRYSVPVIAKNPVACMFPKKDLDINEINSFVSGLLGGSLELCGEELEPIAEQSHF